MAMLGRTGITEILLSNGGRGMIIMGLAVFSVLLLMAVLLVTILFGAAARESAKDAQMRAEWARLEGLERNVSPTEEPYRDHTVPV
jgi:hypothetical protein